MGLCFRSTATCKATSDAMKHAIPHTDPGNGLDRILTVMRQLRDTEDGCPWDVEQTFETIVPYTIEEAYEVATRLSGGTRGPV